MKISKLTLKNIRSYKFQEIEFPNGSILLAGDIGSGKTTILLAIEFALFGLQPGQRGTSLLSNGENEGLVILELSVSGKNIIIERGLRRGSKTVTQDYASLTVDGEKADFSVTEIKTRILELLGYPEEFLKKTNLLYRYTVYSPQEEMKQIILEDAEIRLNMLRHIFGIDKYRKIKDNLLIVTSSLREKARFLQLETRNIEIFRSNISENLVILSKSADLIKEADEKIVIIKKGRKGIELELSSLKEKIKEKQNLEKEIEKTNIQISNKLQNLAEQNKEIKSIENRILGIKESFDEANYQNILDKIISKKRESEEHQKYLIELSSHIKSLSSRKQDDIEKRNRVFSIEICPTCLQDVPEPHKHNILNETENTISKTDKEIDELSIKIEEVHKYIDQSKNFLDILEKEKSRLEILRVRIDEAKLSKSRLEELSRTKESTSKDIDALSQHMTSLKKYIFELSKFDNLVRLKEEELTKAFGEEKKSEIKLAELKKEKEFILKEQTRLTKELAEKEKHRSQYVRLIELEKWLGDDFVKLISFIERNIMIKVRSEFSKLFNNWFALLTTNAFNVQLDENFTPIILQGDYELDYEFLSGGERTAVALAYRLALNQILTSIHSRIRTRDILILDEPTDGFSDAQLDKLRDILKELNTNQLVIVSHEQKIESFVDNIIKIKKEAGYSAKE